MWETPSVVIYNPCFTPSSQPIPHQMPSSPTATHTKSCTPGRDHARSLFNNRWYRNFQKPTRVPTLRNWFHERTRAFHGRSREPSWKQYWISRATKIRRSQIIKMDAEIIWIQTSMQNWFYAVPVSNRLLLHDKNPDPDLRFAKQNICSRARLKTPTRY